MAQQVGLIPLVAVQKPNGRLDMRQANQAILRGKHPVPTIEETLQEFSGIFQIRFEHGFS